jgi:GT2 family glycosyltransferase
MTKPLISVALFTRNRPEFLHRALGSIIGAAGPVAEQVEVAISDGSDDDRAGRYTHKLLDGWPGGLRYLHNDPPLGIVENVNKAVELSSGEWVLLLGDDDYLLPGAGAAMVRAVGRARPVERALLFGATIVDVDGLRLREQTFRRDRYLEPEAALRNLLSNSSWVRMAALLIRRTAIEEAGMFHPEARMSPDTDMWVRLFSRHGVRCVGDTACAVTIHESALTTGMWNESTIEDLRGIFDLAVETGVVPERKIRRWQADYFHQFILAGAYRRLRAGRRAEAGRVLELFELPQVRSIGVSPKWLPVRVAFTAATTGARANRS